MLENQNNKGSEVQQMPQVNVETPIPQQQSVSEKEISQEQSSESGFDENDGDVVNPEDFFS